MMWQTILFALPPQINAPIINKTTKYYDNKYYDRPVNMISKYIKVSKRYKTYK